MRPLHFDIIIILIFAPVIYSNSVHNIYYKLGGKVLLKSLAKTRLLTGTRYDFIRFDEEDDDFGYPTWEETRKQGAKQLTPKQVQEMKLKNKRERQQENNYEASLEKQEAVVSFEDFMERLQDFMQENVAGTNFEKEILKSENEDKGKAYQVDKKVALLRAKEAKALEFSDLAREIQGFEISKEIKNRERLTGKNRDDCIDEMIKDILSFVKSDLTKTEEKSEKNENENEDKDDLESVGDDSLLEVIEKALVWDGENKLPEIVDDDDFEDENENFEDQMDDGEVENFEEPEKHDHWNFDKKHSETQSTKSYSNKDASEKPGIHFDTEPKLKFHDGDPMKEKIEERNKNKDELLYDIGGKTFKAKQDNEDEKTIFSMNEIDSMDADKIAELKDVIKSKGIDPNILDNLVTYYKTQEKQAKEEQKRLEEALRKEHDLSDEGIDAMSQEEIDEALGKLSKAGYNVNGQNIGFNGAAGFNQQYMMQQQQMMQQQMIQQQLLQKQLEEMNRRQQQYDDHQHSMHVASTRFRKGRASKTPPRHSGRSSRSSRSSGQHHRRSPVYHHGGRQGFV